MGGFVDLYIFCYKLGTTSYYLYNDKGILVTTQYFTVTECFKKQVLQISFLFFRSWSMFSRFFNCKQVQKIGNILYFRNYSCFTFCYYCSLWIDCSYSSLFWVTSGPHCLFQNNILWKFATVFNMSPILHC